MTFLVSGCKHDRKLDLGVDFHIFKIKDIKNVKINDVTLTFDLGTQGHTGLTHLLYDLAPIWLFTSYKLDLGVNSNIFEVKDIKNVRINQVTLTVDLGTQGHIHPLYDLS